MKKIITLLLFVFANLAVHGQCSLVGVQVSSSDTTYVQLYNAGFFLIPFGFANVCEWEVTSFSGEIIFEATTSGAFNDQSTVIFDHSIPITDSMKVSLVITNDSAGITCTMNDTLYWKETEVLPGAFIGNWTVLSNNGGVEEDITSSSELIPDVPKIELYPSLVYDHFMIKSDLDNYSFAVLDVNGQVLTSYKNIHASKRVDISSYPAGMYFVQFWDENGGNIGVKKLLKM